MSERSDSGSLTSSYYDSEADSASDTSSGTGYANPRGQEVRPNVCTSILGSRADARHLPRCPPPPTLASQPVLLSRLGVDCKQASHQHATAAASQTAANGTPNLALPDLADGRTQGGAAEPHSTQPGAAALFKSLSIASNGSGTARLPRLNLRSVSMPENSDSTLSISRYGPKPETDVVGATHRGPPPKRPYDVPPAVPEVPLRTELVIELVSPAFSLDAATIASAQEAAIDLSAAALQRASTGLGVDRSALRLFELREVQPGAQLAEDAERVAVAIVGSSAHNLVPATNQCFLLLWHHVISARHTGVSMRHYFSCLPTLVSVS